MNTIKCPHCGTTFTVNETEYSELLAQVRGVEFEKEIHERLAKEVALLEEKAKNQLQKSLSEKEQAIIALENQLKTQEEAKSLEIEGLLAKKEQEIITVKNQLNQVTLEKDYELKEKLSQIEKERDEAKNALVLQEQKQELALKNIQIDYAAQLKAANEQVEFYKNFKAQQSTKAIGESLEVYAETEFNKVRNLAFPNAYFEKDNQVSQRGSKGDFIYRETDDNGVEILSIMFEMKNESDETKTKHKNEDFFKELDRDRNEKNCEYAVLVSMLEADNDYYNTGIVDVSHKYEKMYVVRPQFFIQLIGILRNASMNSLKFKQELAMVKEQNIDITHFEEDLEVFKKAFAKNYQSASTNFKKAIDEIDKAIKRMEAIKAALTTSENQLRLANNKLDDVSVKKLTKKNPTMREKFDNLKQ
ncbi:DUF2130 domain-containing protein [Streptococcus sp. CSL10205-OR2]|nr:DUF2130 domain-containing protein [Streptococcus sp. CSL10205-OR2]MCU9533307.1 DUF2130 domain-containing protein [Streptococcus sp. CSL10205-OR2]